MQLEAVRKNFLSTGMSVCRPYSRIETCEFEEMKEDQACMAGELRRVSLQHTRGWGEGLMF